MTTDETTTARLRGWVEDLYAMEGHVEEALDDQREQDTRSPEVAAAIRTFHDTVRGSRARIEAHLGTFPDGEGSVKESVAELLGNAAGLVDKLRGTTIARAVRDDYVAFNSVWIAYAMLLTSARAAGDDATATIAQQGITDYAGLVQRVNEVIASVTMDDLQADADITVTHPDVADEVRGAIATAWSDS